MTREGDRIGNGCSIALSVIVINAIVSVLLIAGMVHCMTQIAHQQEEIKRYREVNNEASQQKTENKEKSALRSNDGKKDSFRFGLNSATSKAKKDATLNSEGDDENTILQYPRTRCCGVKGEKGDKGESGRDGEGKEGPSGKNGNKGERGHHGPRGPPGPAVKYESVHFVGDGKGKRRFNHKNFVTSWVKDHASENMRYGHGCVKVGVTGYYYIYSQLYYFDTTWTMGHIMCIDDRVVLKSIRTFGNTNISDSQQTMYIGGTFKIIQGQKFCVKVANEKFNHFQPESSFFGAFMIRH